MKNMNVTICAVLLSSVVGCHLQKEDEPVQPKKLFYIENPGARSNAWRVVSHSGNGTQKLVLKVMGPVGATTRGTAAVFTVDAKKVSWGRFSDSVAPATHMKTGSALNLKQGAQTEIQMVKTSVDEAKGELQIGVFQKQDASTLAQEPLAYICLEAKAGVESGVVSLSASDKSMHLKVDEKGVAAESVKFVLGTLEYR